MKLYLIGLDGDHSPYVRDLINKDRLASGDPKLIDQEIEKITQRIKELKEMKKSGSLNTEKIHEFLEKHAPGYKRNAESRSDTQRIRFIEGALMQELRKLGCKSKAEEIDDILLNWPEE